MNYHKAPFPGFLARAAFTSVCARAAVSEPGLITIPEPPALGRLRICRVMSDGWDESDLSDMSDSSDLSDRSGLSSGWILGVAGGGAGASRPRGMVFCSLWDIVFLWNVVFFEGFYV